MKDNEKYWMELYKNNLIEIDFDNGLVYSLLSGKKRLLKCKGKSGYLQASAGKTRKDRNYILLHRLIWIAKNGEISDNIEINHKNGKKSDNRIDNLEVVTKSENALHSIRILKNKTGVSRGEMNGSSKLKAENVLEIRSNYIKKDVTMKYFAEKFCVSISSIDSILKNKTWKEAL